MTETQILKMALGNAQDEIVGLKKVNSALALRSVAIERVIKGWCGWLLIKALFVPGAVFEAVRQREVDILAAGRAEVSVTTTGGKNADR